MKANALIRLALSAALAAAFCAAARAVSVSVSPSGTINSGQTVTIVGSESSATAGSLTLEARPVSSGSWIAIGGGGPSYCSASYAFPVGGTWEVRCRFSGYLAGWPPPGTYYSGSATTTVNVTAPAPQVSSIAFTPPSGQVGYGTPVEAKAWLTTPFPSNGQVSFAIYSPTSSTTPAQVINVATNSNTASAVFAPSSAGIWTVRATGSGTYNGAPTSHSATASFQALAYISPSVTSLAAAAEVPAVNFPVTLTAAVSADYAADGAVVFEVKKSGAAQWTSVAVEPIGSNRQAVGRWIPDSAGSWSVRCRSQGRVLVGGALQFHVSNGYCNLAGGYYASGVSAANPYFAAVDEWNLTGKPAYWKDINGDGLRDKFQEEPMAYVSSYTDWGAAWLPNPCCVSVIGWLFGSVSTDALCCGAIMVPVANGAYNNYSVDVEIVEGHAQQLYMEFHNDSNGSRVGFVTEASGTPGAVKRVVMPDVSVSLSWRKIVLITLAKIVFNGNRNDSPHISEVAVQSVSGSNDDALLLDAEVEVLNASGTDLKIKVPSVVSLPPGTSIDWADQRAYGNTSVWNLDLDGNGAIDTVLNPINASGRVSVPILGKIVEVTLDRDGVSVSIGKFQIGRDFDGALRVGLPASLAGSDGQIVLKFSPLSSGCGSNSWVNEDANADGQGDEVWYDSITPCITTANGTNTITELKSLNNLEISQCQAVQAQYRIGNGAWTDLGGLYLGFPALCRGIREVAPPALVGANLPDVKFRIVRYSGSVSLPSLGYIGKGETRSYSVSYAPKPHANPSRNVRLGLLLRIGGGAVFAANNSSELYVESAGSASFSVKGTASGSCSISATFAHRASPGSPIVTAHVPCQSGSFGVVGISISKAKGLYESTATPKFSSNHGAYRAGYKSQDNEGRVYANRAPTVGTADSSSDGLDDDPSNSNPDGTPKYDKGKTYVDFTVDVGMTFASAPSGVKVVWEFEDPDDPSDSGMSAAAAAQIDPNSSTGEDNLKKALGDVAWSNVPGAPTSYGVSQSAHTPTGGYNRYRATSTVDKHGRSMVRMKLSQAGGDNYKVKAKLQIDGQDTGIADASGVFTVWKLVHLENARTPNGDTQVAQGSLNSRFSRSFVHWDIRPVDTGYPNEPMNSGSNWYYGPRTSSTATNSAFTYANTNFKKVGVPGWFMFSSTSYFRDLDWRPTQFDYQSATFSHSAVLVASSSGPTSDIAGSIELTGASIDTSKAKQLVILRNLGSPNQQQVIFSVSSVAQVGSVYTLTLNSPKYSFDVDNIHSSGHYMNLANHGFSSISSGEVVIVLGERTEGKFASGLSVIDSAGNFTGRSMLFKSTSLITMMHELCHALGNTHNCGNFSSENGNERCAMLYGTNWIRNSSGGLIKWSDSNVYAGGEAFCSDHILSMRNTDLSNDASSPSRTLSW